MLRQEISRYEIIGKLGEGEMGIVYKAFDRLLSRNSALKFPKHAVQDEASRVRFHREAEAASKVNHPNVCAVYGTGEAQGRSFIALEYLQGKTLDVVIACGPRPVREALVMVLQVARGLAAIHEAGIVHRDIKPANIMLTPDRGAVILDFGLAYDPAAPKITGAGHAAGTLAFMSPEQALGKQVDHRSDIWSAGVLLYNLLTGRLPFEGTHEQSILYSLINEQPTPLPPCGETAAVQQRLVRIIDRALTKHPVLRYPSANALVETIEAMLLCEL